MLQMTIEEALARYTELLSSVRLLSAPETEEGKGEDEYKENLVRNFTHIGDMAEEIKSLLDETVFPLLNNNEELTKEQIVVLSDFSKALVNTSTVNYLDPMLCYKIAERLLADAEKKDDIDLLIRALDKIVDSSYIMIYLTRRLMPCDDSFYDYREKGLTAAKRILEYLDKEKFAALPNDDLKEIVLVNSRYIDAIEYVGERMEDDEREEMLGHLQTALDLEHDSFYREALPSYDWKRHRFRTYQYMISCTELNNICGLNEKQLEKVFKAYDGLEELWEEDREMCESLCSRRTTDLYAARISYLRGRTNIEEYKTELRRIHALADPYSFGLHDIIANIFVLEEYLMAVRESGTTDDDVKYLEGEYKRLIAYFKRMPKSGSIIFATTEIIDVVKLYVDVPAVSLTELCAGLTAAIHPPTFVHSLTMSSIVVCLTEHLLRKKPELFSEFRGDVTRFARTSSLFHDIGKLFVIECIMMYGRDLFDEEFKMIRKHAEVGAHVLKSNKKTCDYQALAAGHHFRFDELESKAAEGVIKREEIPFVAIATCADGLDAATDTVGRSYKRGKSLETVIEELRRGSGTFYAPYVVELFDDPAVTEDVRKILTEGRENNYRNTYRVLAAMNEASDSPA